MMRLGHLAHCFWEAAAALHGSAPLRGAPAWSSKNAGSQPRQRPHAPYPPTPTLPNPPPPPRSTAPAAAEKLRFIRLLQEVAERQGVRVTVLSGDAHVGGAGQLYSRPKIKDAR